jgi:hypothetical protein
VTRDLDALPAAVAEDLGGASGPRNRGRSHGSPFDLPGPFLN